jgi:hypothetical protein
MVASPAAVWILAVGRAGAEAVSLVQERRGGRSISVSCLADVAVLIREGLSGIVFILVDACESPAEDLISVSAAAAKSPSEIAIGVLRAHGASELRAAAQRLSRDGAARPEPAVQRMFVAPDQSLTLRGARLDDGGICARSAEQTLAELQEPSAISYFVGHANAMHLCLDGVLVCRRGEVQLEPDDLGVYPCLRGEACHFGRNRGDLTLSTGKIGAKRLVSMACFGANTSGFPFSAHASVGDGLLQHPSIEVILTTCRAASVNSADLALVYYLVNCGLAFGDVARRVNAFRIGRGEAADLICFGDPESRVERSVEDVPCRLSGNQIVIQPGEDCGTARDLCTKLPRDWLPQQPVLVDETAGTVLNAVVDPAGTLYVTVPRAWHSRPIRFTVKDRRELQDCGGSVLALAEDMGFIDMYLPLLAEVNGTSERLDDLTAAAHALREQLRVWPLLDPPVFQCIEERQIAALWRAVQKLAENFGERLVAYYAAIMQPDHRTYPTPWDSRVVTLETHRGAYACAYCGHPVDEFLTQARLGSMRRKWAICRTSCAYVFDGDPDLGRWLRAPRVLEAGEVHEIEIDTRNPYGVPLTAQAIGVLKHFDNRRSELTSPVKLDGEPGAAGTVRLSLRVPDDFVSGTYHFSACVTIGTRVNFLRAQVIIRGS